MRELADHPTAHPSRVLDLPIYYAARYMRGDEGGDRLHIDMGPVTHTQAMEWATSLTHSGARTVVLRAVAKLEPSATITPI